MKEEDKARLLGRALTTRSVGGQHVVDEKKALAPFRDSDSVVRIFCAGCGAIMELNREDATQLTAMAGAAVDSFTGTYLECSRCICCDSGFKDPALKRTE